jgi:signal peptidase I
MALMPTQTPERIIRPFLLYGGLIFTIVHRAVLAGTILLFVHLFVVTIVPIRGDSMAPTIADGTYILVDQLSPLLRSFSRGEIVAFRYPLNPKQRFIKRTVGLPHESIIVRGGQVSVQRPGDAELIRLREPYLSPGIVTRGDVSYVVGPIDYVVLGDNREVSLDSRTFGPISESYILGRAWIAIWPLPEFRLISHFDPTMISL